MLRYQIYKSNDSGEQCWRWRLLDDKGNNIAHSEEPFLKQDILASIKKIREKANDAPIWQDENKEDKDKGYRFEYYKSSKDGKWRWRFRAGNHETMAIGDPYDSENDIKNALEYVKKEMANAKIEWENPKDDPSHKEKQDDCTETKGIPGSI